MTDINSAIACLERGLQSNTHDGIQDTDAVYEALECLLRIRSGPSLTSPIPTLRASQDYKCKYVDICSGFEEHKCAGCKA